MCIRDRIGLEIKTKKVTVDIVADDELNVQNPAGLSLHTEAVYLDDPFVLDEAGRPLYAYSSYWDHRNQLKRKIFAEKSRASLADEIIACLLYTSYYVSKEKESGEHTDSSFGCGHSAFKQCCSLLAEVPQILGCKHSWRSELADCVSAVSYTHLKQIFVFL